MIRWLFFDTEALLELGRDGNLLEAVVEGHDRGRLRILVTREQAEALELASGDMACAAQAQLERLPITAAGDPARLSARHRVIFVTDDPQGERVDASALQIHAVWTLNDLRDRLRR